MQNKRNVVSGFNMLKIKYILYMFSVSKDFIKLNQFLYESNIF